MELKLEVYSPALELLGVLEVFDSLLVQRRAFGAGSFSLESLLTGQTRQLLQPENILWMEGETAGIIEYVQQQAGPDGPGVTVKGPLLTGLLARRILWGRYDLTGSPAQIMTRLVEDCCISPTRGETAQRKLPGLVLAETAQAQGAGIRLQKTGGSLLEALEQLGETYQVAFGIRFNPQVPRLEFWTRPGLDRSVDQAEREPVFYSTELDDVLASEYCYDASDYHNICLAAGEGEGADRVFTTVTGKVEQPEPGPGPGPEPERYTVSLAAQPEGGGTVSGGGEMAAGGQITVTAVPAEGYAFAGWQEEGAIVSTEPVYSFVVAADRALTALFDLILPTYTIAISLEEGQQGWGTLSGGGQYRQGDPVTVTATPAEGYQFVEWRENGQQVGTEAAYTFPAERDRSLIAVFAVLKPSRLPAGYTEVEYIQSDENCAIDTGMTANVKTTRFEIDLEAGAYESGDESICGGMVNSAPRMYLWRKSATVVSRRLGSAGSSSTTTINIANRRLTISFINSVLKIGSTKITDLSPLSSTMPGNLCLFWPPNGAYGTKSIKAKLYSCKLYNGSSLARDFVPCVNSAGVAGLYDLIGGKFYQNARSGTFSPGPAV